MKLKATKKQIRQNFNTILSIGYCDAQYLLDCKNPFAYSAGLNGCTKIINLLTGFLLAAP